MKTEPTISILIPAYQCADLIGETLASVVAQTRDDWEAIIIDDGSTDDLVGAVTPYLVDQRFSLHHFENGGLPVARNRGMRIARGRVLVLLDSDDLFEPTYLAEMVAALDSTPGAVVACCDAIMFGVPDREGRLVSEFEPMDTAPTLTNLLASRFQVHGSTAMDAAAVRALGGFSEGMPAAEDYDMWLRLLMAGGSIVHLPKPLHRYRRRAGSLSNTPTKLYVGRAEAYLRALRSLDARSEDAAIARRSIARLLGRLEYFEGERALLAGDIATARDRLREAGRQGALSPRWRLLRALLHIAPGVAAWLVRRRQAQSSPLSQLAAATA